MKASIGFLFFMLFLAGLALVNLRARQDQSNNAGLSQETLIRTAWRPIRLGEMRLPDDTEMFVQFDPDEQVLGFAGCNRFTGSYTLGVEALQVGPLAATRMACEEPAMSFELSFLQALEETATASASNQFLALKSAEGHTLLRLTAVERKTPD